MLFKNASSQRFAVGDWQFQQRLTPTCRLLRHRQATRHCQQHLLQLQSQSDKSFYQQRLNNPSPFLVRLLHLESFSQFTSNNEFSHYTLRVFMEHVRFRLSEVEELPEEYLLGLLEDTLAGFRVIYEQYQPVRVEAAMICINEDKKVKVWLSEDLLRNVGGEGGQVPEWVMVEDVFRVYQRFSKRCDDRRRNMGFQDAFEYVQRKRGMGRMVVMGEPHRTMTGNMSTLSTNSRNSPPTKHNTSRQQPPPQYPSTSTLYPNLTVRPDPFHPPPPFPSTTTTTTCTFQPFQRRQLLSMIDSPNHDHNLQDPSRRHSIVVGIESARTTSQNLVVNENFIELDKSQLQQQLLDQKKTKEARLEIIKMAQENNPHDQTIQKVCRVFSHALKYDPLMYCELRRAQGRISRITNQYIVRKIADLLKDSGSRNNNNNNGNNNNGQNSPHLKNVQRVDTRQIRIKTQQQILSPETEKAREERLKKILQKQRQKRNRTMYSKKMSNNESGIVGFNKTQEAKTVRSEIRTGGTGGVPDYISELQSLIGIGPSIPMKQSQTEKKKQKTKFYKDFKQEVEKLLFD